jgi:hypothetical protein
MIVCTGIAILAILLFLAVMLPWPTGALIALGIGALVAAAIACGLRVVREDAVLRFRLPGLETIESRVPRLSLAAGVAAGILAVFAVLLTAVLAFAT